MLNNARRFEGKTAIVTGGSRGIGIEIARRLAREGAKVMVADILPVSEEHLGEGIEFCLCDVSKEENILRCIDAFIERHGRWDVVVNNAGKMIHKKLADLEMSEWHDVFATDLFAAVVFTREALRRMKPGGAIVNVSSVHGSLTSADAGPYAAAKAALDSLGRTATIEGRALGIRTNTVVPGPIETVMLRSNPGAKDIPEEQIGRPEDVAAAVAFLASDEAPDIQGSTLRVDAGQLAMLSE